MGEHIEIIWINATLALLSVLNVAAHSYAVFLLHTVYKKGNETNEIIYLINLSVVELLASFIMLLDEGLETITALLDIPDEILIIMAECDHYVFILTYLLFCVYYVAMTYITLDRVLTISLHIRYPVYWNQTKSIYTTLVTWLNAIIMFILISVAYYFSRFDYQCMVTQYIFPTLNFGFITLVICSYSYLFHKYHRARLSPSTCRTKSENMLKTFRNSRFRVNVYLVVSFLLFMVVPNVAFLFMNERDEVKIAYEIAFMSDIVLYICMQPTIRNKRISKGKKTYVPRQIHL